MKILLTTLNAKFVQSSLALRCLAAACRQQGFGNVETAEYTINHNAYDILRRIHAFHADVIGFSCYIWNIDMTLHLISLLRQICPDVTIMVGGPEVTYTARELLTAEGNIDYALQGEGEAILPELIASWLNGEDGTAVGGVLRRTADGAIEGNELIREVPDLDLLPFPYDDADLASLSHQLVYYESSRGCPFHCQYCLSGRDDTVRFRSAALVIEELKRLVAAGVKQVKLVDRTFNCNPRHYRPILAFMVSLQATVNFHLEIEPGLVTEEDLALLSQAPRGRIQLELGIQSTYGPTLQAIRRHNDWPHIVHVMNVIRSLGTIHLHLDLIVGLPYETMQALRRSFNDIYSLQPHKLQIGFLKLLKGSGIRRDYSQDYACDLRGPYEVLATKWLSYEAVGTMKVFEDVFERIYNSGKFSYTLAYVDRFFAGDWFSFYERLTDHWLCRGFDRLAVSDATVCHFLWDSLTALTELTAEEKDVARQLLCLDMLTCFRFRLKPSFLGWEEAPRQLTDPFFRREEGPAAYFTGYRFTNWRDIKMRYHLWPITPAVGKELRRYADGPDEAAYILAESGADGVCWRLLNKAALAAEGVI
ncbi:B12-binding domain-containing radical SAM protein [Megasphaera vaginalis (ex Srinivasan et al. 2021)]|nr:B12-binding domain-containing radical SAM protein [Megasphaera vaginalis (ex Srinivasan et al. 2021)]